MHMRRKWMMGNILYMKKILPKHYAELGRSRLRHDSHGEFKSRHCKVIQEFEGVQALEPIPQDVEFRAVDGFEVSSEPCMDGCSMISWAHMLRSQGLTAKVAYIGAPGKDLSAYEHLAPPVSRWRTYQRKQDEQVIPLQMLSISTSTSLIPQGHTQKPALDIHRDVMRRPTTMVGRMSSTMEAATT